MENDMNIITAQRTYKTPANAERALKQVCEKHDVAIESLRWFIAVAASSTDDDVRFVPTIMLDAPENCGFAHLGIMVVK